MGCILTGPWRVVKPGTSASEHDRRNECESLGDIMARLRRERRSLEQTIRPRFNRELSLALDECLSQEDRVALSMTDSQPDAIEGSRP